MDQAAALEALGDGTRRQIVDLLRAGPKSVQEIADELPVSRPAVSRHLRLLKEASLVVDEPVGTRRLYRLDPHGLAALRSLFDDLWDVALARFRLVAETTPERS